MICVAFIHVAAGQIPRSKMWTERRTWLRQGPGRSGWLLVSLQICMAPSQTPPRATATRSTRERPIIRKSFETPPLRMDSYDHLYRRPRLSLCAGRSPFPYGRDYGGRSRQGYSRRASPPAPPLLSSAITFEMKRASAFLAVSTLRAPSRSHADAPLRFLSLLAKRCRIQVLAHFQVDPNRGLSEDEVIKVCVRPSLPPIIAPRKRRGSSPSGRRLWGWARIVRRPPSFRRVLGESHTTGRPCVWMILFLAPPHARYALPVPLRASPRASRPLRAR